MEQETQTLEQTKLILENAMTAIGALASKETDLGSAIDDAWNSLDDIVEAIKDGNYSESGEFIA